MNMTENENNGREAVTDSASIPGDGCHGACHCVCVCVSNRNTATELEGGRSKAAQRNADGTGRNQP